MDLGLIGFEYIGSSFVRSRFLYLGYIQVYLVFVGLVDIDVEIRGLEFLSLGLWHRGL